MQLTMTTDYAIRCLPYLSQNNGVSTSQKVREFAQISSDEHTRKILRQLKYGGLVRSDKGANGGYALARPLSAISFLDVVRCTEDSVRFNRLSSIDPSEYTEQQKAVAGFYSATQQMLEEYLGSITIQEILDGKLPTWGKLN